MRPILFVLWIGLFAGSLFTQQRLLKSEISAVTVYTDRADIRRSATVQLTEGDFEFIFQGLPAELDDQSLRIAGEGTAKAKIADIRIETEYIDTIPKNTLKNLQEQMVQLQDEERVIGDRIVLLTKEKDFLDLIKVNATAPRGEKELRTSVDEWTRLFGFYDQNFEKIHQELRALDKKKSEIAKKKSQLEEQINQLSGYTQLKRKKAVMTVNVTRAGQMKFDLSYVVPGARWYPYYDVRVSPDDQSVELIYYAVISQNTGEDWNNVSLSISTARPYIAGAVPVLGEWYLSIYQPSYKYATRDEKSRSYVVGARSFSKETAKKAAESETTADEESTAILDYETTSVEQRSTSVVFNVRKLSTIPSDRQEHKITVAIEKLKSVFEYTTIPKLAPHAYLTAWVENTTDFPFLAGNTNIFFGNSFVGNSAIPTVTPTEKLQVSLGVDDGIKIKRESIRDFRSETGIFSKNIKKTYEYKITVESYRKSEDTIKIRDHFPIPRDERIKVELLIPNFDKKDQTILTVPNGVVEKMPGQILEWRLRLKPKEKYELRLKYTVEYPRDLKIEGLE